jgi:nitrogenase subunit NifH
MSKEEILVTTTGEMAAMFACMAIYSGSAKQKKKQRMESILFDM